MFKNESKLFDDYLELFPSLSSDSINMYFKKKAQKELAKFIDYRFL